MFLIVGVPSSNAAITKRATVSAEISQIIQ
jgi:hypothetical protein